VKGRLFRIMVPVNLRGNEKPGALGNRISLVPVTVPLDIRNPRRLLAAVHKRTEFLKHAHAAELVSLAGGLIGMLPTSLQALVGPVLSKLPITPFNLVCTNVPGPQNPLYLLGHQLLTWFPYVPVGGEMAANCAILSYNGTMFFGFSGDVHAAPDLRRLEALLKLSFEELRDAAGVRPPEKRKSRVRPKAPVASKSKPRRAAVVPVPIPTPNPPSPEPVRESTPKAASEQVLQQLIA
jgi:diacylglycerol O-acyltransferase